MNTLRVLLVNSSLPFLESMKRFVTLDERIQVVGLSRSSTEALDCIDELQPDLVLVDMLMPGLSGFEIAAYIKSERKGPCVVIMALEDNLDYRDAVRDAQADGFLSKPEIDTQWLPLLTTLFPNFTAGAQQHSSPVTQ